MKRADAVDLWPIRDAGKVEVEADFDDGFGVRLDFVHHAQDFSDLAIECAGFAVENVAVGMGAGVVIIHEFSVTADLAVVAGDERLSVMEKLISNNYLNRIPKLLFTWGKQVAKCDTKCRRYVASVRLLVFSENSKLR